MKPTALRLALVLILWHTSVSAQAGGPLITEPLLGEVVFGPGLGEIATGSFTYDPTAITGTGEESVTFPELTLTIDFLSQTFTEADDTDFDLYPELSLVDGVPVFLDFLVLNGDGVGQEILDPEIDFFSFFELTPEPGGGFFVPIFTIPEPTAMGLLAVAAALFGLGRRRQVA